MQVLKVYGRRFQNDYRGSRAWSSLTTVSIQFSIFLTSFSDILAGTLSGNPVAVAAGTAMLKLLMGDTAVYERLEEKSARIENAFRTAVEKYHIKAQVNRVGSLMSIFFTDRPVKSFDDVQTSDLAQFAK